MSSDYDKEKFLLIGNLTPNLIHDIRNSLSVLKLNYYFLSLKEDSIPAELASSLKDCSEAINRLEKKLDNFSLLITNHDNSREVCALNLITAIALDLLKGKARKNNVSLEDVSGSNTPTLKINKTKIIIAVIGIINSLLETGVSNQKIVLNVLTNDEHQVELEIEKKQKDNLKEQNLIIDNVNIFLKNVEEVRNRLKDDGVTISFEGEVKGNCKINFSFNKQ